MDKIFKIGSITGIPDKWNVSLNQTKHLIIDPRNKESWHLSGGIRGITCEVNEQRGRPIADIWTDRWHELCFLLVLNAIIRLNESACDPHRQVKIWIPFTLNYLVRLDYCWLEHMNPDFMTKIIFIMHTIRLRELK